MQAVKLACYPAGWQTEARAFMRRMPHPQWSSRRSSFLLIFRSAIV